MLKIILVSVALLFVFCSDRIEDQNIKFQGKAQIGDNLYIKKIMIGSDRVYFLVDQNDNLVTGTVNTSFTVSDDGKTTRVESNSFIIK